MVEIKIMGGTIGHWVSLSQARMKVVGGKDCGREGSVSHASAYTHKEEGFGLRDRQTRPSGVLLGKETKKL